MDQYDNVVKLSEDISIPDGYNVVRIIGNGDRRKVEAIPRIQVTSSKTSMVSDGIQIAEITIKITDVNALNPFVFIPDVIEKVSPSIYDLSVSHWIANTPLVYEMYVDPVFSGPVPVDHVLAERIHIVETWQPTRVPSYAVGLGLTGFIYREAWVKYTSCMSITLGVGKNADDPNLPGYIPWWVNPEKKLTLPENECNGDFYSDSGGLNPIWTNKVRIENIPGNITSIRVYFKPDPGDSGSAYVNCEYDGSTGYVLIDVKSGGVGVGGGGNISLSANPEIIPVEESSLISADVMTADGYPFTATHISFHITSGSGYMNPANAPLSVSVGEQQLVMSSLNMTVNPPIKTMFNLTKPIIRVTKIETVANLNWKWNGMVRVIGGKEVHLVNQEYPYETTPLKVTYDWGGKATSRFYPSSSAVAGSVNWITGSVGSTFSTPVSVTIGEPPSSIYTIELDAETPLRQEPTPDLEEPGYGGAWGWVKVIGTKPVRRASHKIDYHNNQWEWDVEPTFYDQGGIAAGYWGTGPIDRGDVVDLNITPKKGAIEDRVFEERKHPSINPETGIMEPTANATITGLYTCTVEYPIERLDSSSVIFNGLSYPIPNGRFDGNTIYIGDRPGSLIHGFGLTSSSIKGEVKYTSGGIMRGVYKTSKVIPPGKTTVETDYIVNLSAAYEGQYSTKEVIVGNPAIFAALELSLISPYKEGELITKGVGIVSAKLFSGTSPQEDVKITFKILEASTAVGSYFAEDATLKNPYPFTESEQFQIMEKNTGKTNPIPPSTRPSRGYAYVNLKAGGLGVIIVQASTPDGKTATLMVEVVEGNTGGIPFFRTVNIATVSGTIDYVDGVSLTPDSCGVVEMGATGSTDEFGGVWHGENIAPMKLKLVLGRDAITSVPGMERNNPIVGITVYDSGKVVRSSYTRIVMSSPLVVDFELEWDIVANKAKDANIEILQWVNGESGSLTIPLPGAKVSMAGQTVITNGRGIAVFSGKNLNRGTSYPIDISSPNHQDNRAFATGSGVYDSNTGNDAYMVPEASDRPYLLDTKNVQAIIEATVVDYKFPYQSLYVSAPTTNPPFIVSV